MIRIGQAGYPPGASGMVDAIIRTKALGLDAMEVQFVRNVSLQDSVAAEAMRKASELGVMLSAHAPYYISLNSRSPETVEKSRGWILRTARAAKALGAWIIVIHCASYSGVDAQRTTRNVIEQIAMCRKELDDEGDHVILGLETMGKKGQWGTMAEIQEVMKEVHGVQPVIDFAHIHARGGGAIRGREDFEAVLDEHDLLPTVRTHCHFSGIEFTAAGEKNHLPLDSGSPSYAPLAEVLSDGDREMTLICETTSPAADAVKMRSMLEMARSYKRTDRNKRIEHH
ncbi:MAG: TIM barrel protein [Euryarchaeota archaeon]|nr:TIM barrel protein [Euryarchaeota archaeon]